ncbi:hypothetical protein GBAR_LOCUS28378 [Geodia barretti]|uniref:Uncharacterized protein n=1 Tax=Geodia barretti TaxID=519541 RepID=A0AA35TQA8_GEOBA|nr:hypothetical protein GBAR_LOCUS28378 [Geodia barretti]
MRSSLHTAEATISEERPEEKREACQSSPDASSARSTPTSPVPKIKSPFLFTSDPQPLRVLVHTETNSQTQTEQHTWRVKKSILGRYISNQGPDQQSLKESRKWKMKFLPGRGGSKAKKGRGLATHAIWIVEKGLLARYIWDPSYNFAFIKCSKQVPIDIGCGNFNPTLSLLLYPLGLFDDKRSNMTLQLKILIPDECPPLLPTDSYNLSLKICSAETRTTPGTQLEYAHKSYRIPFDQGMIYIHSFLPHHIIKQCESSALEFHITTSHLCNKEDTSAPSLVEVESPKHRQNLVTTPKLLNFNHPQFFNFDTTSATEGERTFDGCLLPESMTPLSILSDCTSEGRKFTDEANDFSLEIPEGAIPEGESHTVDVGVGLFGPFQFPEGLRPVSPVFWVCVRDQKNFQFSKHVPVTIPHFLNLENEDDIQSLGLTFLKADHNKNSEGLYEFNPTDGEMDFQTFKSHGILRTLHFCSLCIAARDIPKSLQKALFCITAVLPKFSIPVGKSINLYFIITFLNLKTCLKKVDDIIATMELDGHKTKQLKFQFNTNTRTPALEMVITQPKHGKIGLSGNTKVFRSEVDFFVKRRLTEGELNTLKSDKFYPPRFEGYFASFRENATLDDGKIVFKGATSDIVYDIHLDCPTAIPAIKEAVDMSTHTESKLLLDIDRDLHIAKRHLQHLSKQELKDIFLELGLFDATVRDNLTDSSRDSYAEDLIRAWILGRDGIMIKEEYKGGATWENLKKALRNINHPGVAATI